jgi:hypothetical protein
MVIDDLIKPCVEAVQLHRPLIILILHLPFTVAFRLEIVVSASSEPS